VTVRQTGQFGDALIVFADIIGSSKYSAILGYQEYAKRLIEFQELFRSLGRRYFPEPEDKTVDYCHVDARADEGIVFVACPQKDRQEKQARLVMRAIEFLYHLKARLRFRSAPESGDAPRRFDVGAGVHWGPVVLTISRENNRSTIAGMEGYAINYAKRVESCSRQGEHSAILLSSEASKSLEFYPIVLSSLRGGLKGIDENVELYEVESGLFDHLELRQDDEDDGLLIREAERLCREPISIDSQWIKALTVSVLECELTGTDIPDERRRYRNLQYKMAWHSAKEHDPILIYLRGRECRESKQWSREIRHYRDILKKHPHFVHARLLMVKACWNLAQQPSEKQDILFVRDIAKEFLERYDHFLNDEERKEFKSLLETTANPDTKKRHQQAKGSAGK